MYDLNEEDYDTDASAEIEDRLKLNWEPSDTESNLDGLQDNDFYICNRKKGTKILYIGGTKLDTKWEYFDLS